MFLSQRKTNCFQKVTLACLFVLVPVTPLLAEAQPRPKPSLDTLLIRVQAYWSLLQKGKKLQALQYVAPTSKDNFLATQTPDFSDPRVAGLTLSSKPDEVTVTVSVKRVLPQLGTAPMDWPVSEKWAFRNGNWFVVTAGKAVPYALGPGKPARETLSPQEVEQRQSDIRARLHFERQAFDLGTVRKGVTAPIEIRYSLSGNEPIDVALSDASSELVGLSDRKLRPGNDQNISMRWITAEYDGPARAHFSLVSRHHDVEVAYQFEVKADVYTPISARPGQIVFPKDEQKVEFTVRNNSQSEVRISRYFSQTGIFKVSSIPQVLPPGEQVVMSVMAAVSVSQKNFKDIISLSFDRPIEGMATLIIPITLNYEKPVEEKRIMGLTQKQLNELLRKAQQQPGKP